MLRRVFERTTIELRQILISAHEHARNLGDTEIDVQHLFTALVSDGGATWEDRHQQRGSQAQGTTREALRFSAQARRAIELSLRDAHKNGDAHIGPEHLRTALASISERHQRRRRSIRGLLTLRK
jgi:ATP-dependent Clp protease ATP-binding subunit ClpA